MVEQLILSIPSIAILALVIYAVHADTFRGWWLKWRWPKWSRSKQVGYLLLRSVNGSPVMTKLGNHEIVEEKDSQSYEKP